MSHLGSRERSDGGGDRQETSQAKPSPDGVLLRARAGRCSPVAAEHTELTGKPCHTFLGHAPLQHCSICLLAVYTTRFGLCCSCHACSCCYTCIRQTACRNSAAVSRGKGILKNLQAQQLHIALFFPVCNSLVTCKQDLTPPLQLRCCPCSCRP